MPAQDSSRVFTNHVSALQKKGNGMTGSEMAREKEKVAAKMREKQALGWSTLLGRNEVNTLQLMRRRRKSLSRSR